MDMKTDRQRASMVDKMRKSITFCSFFFWNRANYVLKFWLTMMPFCCYDNDLGEDDVKQLNT